MCNLEIATKLSVEVRDKNGNIVPPNPIPEPIWTWAFRYYRLSQDSQDIFEAYRNLFLSLEALLNEILPKKRSEHEKTWLENALSKIASKVTLFHHVPVSVSNPIEYLIKTQYTDVRCRLFHAKFPDALLPHAELNPTDVLAAYQTLLNLWRDIAEAYFSVPRGGGVFTYQGFKWLLDKMFSQPFSLHFTEDNSVPKSEDTNISPLGMDTFDFARTSYLSQTEPGFVSWQGELPLLDIDKNLMVHRICTKVGDTLMNVAFIKDGLSPAGADVFETYLSTRLVNKDQPNTTF